MSNAETRLQERIMDDWEKDELVRDAQDHAMDLERDRLIRAGLDKIHEAGFRTIPGTVSKLVTEDGDTYLVETIMVYVGGDDD